jgi:hypothetical protein
MSAKGFSCSFQVRLGSPPAYTGEIHEGRSGLDDERVDSGSLHESLRFRDSRFALTDGNGHSIASHVLEWIRRAGTCGRCRVRESGSNASRSRHFQEISFIHRLPF